MPSEIATAGVVTLLTSSSVGISEEVLLESAIITSEVVSLVPLQLYPAMIQIQIASYMPE